MTPRVLILDSAARLNTAGIPDAATDAALLLSYLTGRDPLMLRMDTDTELSRNTVSSFQALLMRRLSREPLQYIIGSVPFYSRFFSVCPDVLIPRNETALLVEWALQIIGKTDMPKILDLCCGSGCIGITLKKEKPDAVVTMSDLSKKAVAVARSNAEALDAEVRILQGDLFLPLDQERFDLIISNPPYIPTDECSVLQPEVMAEPHMALDGGTDGLDFYRRIISAVGTHLEAHGYLMFEVGIGEADAVSDILYRSGARNVVVRKDYSGIDRMIAAGY